MSGYDDFVDAVKEGVEGLAERIFKEFKTEAVADTEGFLEQSMQDFERWTGLLGSGVLSEDDFEWLVMGRKDVMDLVRLKELGFSQVRIDRFKNVFLDLLIEKAFVVFL